MTTTSSTTLVPEFKSNDSFYVIELAAMFNFTNRIMSAYGMRPDDEFMAAEIAPHAAARS